MSDATTLRLEDFQATPRPGDRLCALGDLPEQTALVRDFGAGAERVQIFVLRHAGNCHAYVNVCPHALLPLDWRPGHFLSRDGTHILCANHGALFRIADGVCVAGDRAAVDGSRHCHCASAAAHCGSVKISERRSDSTAATGCTQRLTQRSGTPGRRLQYR